MNLEELGRALAGASGAEYDCRHCGACCLSFAGAAAYVLLTGEEASRLRRLGLPIVEARSGEPCLGTCLHHGRGGGTACVAFDGAAGFPSGCSIYEDRPAPCRDFEMGSAACRTARLHAGLPV